MDQARRYFRAIESAVGWECRQGPSALDAHGSFAEAADHLSELGEMHAPAEVFAHHLDGFAHHLDGTVISVAIFEMGSFAFHRSTTVREPDRSLGSGR